jgi:hypothetical protein
LDLAIKNLHTLKQLDNSKKYNHATQGSLITTDNGIFFISIGVGKLEIKSNKYFVVSLLSPIGSAMKGLSKNEKFTFRSIKYFIKNIE